MNLSKFQNKNIQLQIISLVEIVIIIILLTVVVLNTYTPVFVIKSDSMEPVIPTGSLVLMKRAFGDKTEEYFQEKVIAYYNPIKNKIIVHRVIGIKNGFLITKGDNNDFVDTILINPKKIIGELVKVIKLP